MVLTTVQDALCPGYPGHCSYYGGLFSGTWYISLDFHEAHDSSERHFILYFPDGEWPMYLLMTAKEASHYDSHLYFYSTGKAEAEGLSSRPDCPTLWVSRAVWITRSHLQTNKHQIKQDWWSNHLAELPAFVLDCGAPWGWLCGGSLYVSMVAASCDEITSNHKGKWLCLRLQIVVNHYFVSVS